jgi:hypothetical protein
MEMRRNITYFLFARFFVKIAGGKKILVAYLCHCLIGVPLRIYYISNASNVSQGNISQLGHAHFLDEKGSNPGSIL